MAKGICKVCGSDAIIEVKGQLTECNCQVCGRYAYKPVNLSKFDLNHLGAYLAYNKSEKIEEFFATMDQEWCDEQKGLYKDGLIDYGLPIRLNPEDVENWYPKTFAEKIDLILLYLYSKCRHIGELIYLNNEECNSIFFIDRFDYDNGMFSIRDNKKVFSQFCYIKRYLESSNYISKFNVFKDDAGNIKFELTPEAYNRIDDLQKNNTIGNQVLVAMEFGDDTKPLREAIRQGVSAAGYKAIFIDEVQHNDFITPELLKYIKDSKFVVVDLTHKNNGAYFEEGYAMGLGKPVIQLCKEGVPLHFDIAQKNTIMWITEDEIAERLKNRINATID